MFLKMCIFLFSVPLQQGFVLSDQFQEIFFIHLWYVFGSFSSLWNLGELVESRQILNC